MDCLESSFPMFNCYRFMVVIFDTVRVALNCVSYAVVLECRLSRRPVALKAGASTCKRWVSSHARQCWVGSMFTCCVHFVSLHRAQLIDIDYIVFNFEDPVDRGPRLSVHSNAFSDCKLLRTGSWHRVTHRCHSLITNALRRGQIAMFF